MGRVDNGPLLRSSPADCRGIATSSAALDSRLLGCLSFEAREAVVPLPPPLETSGAPFCVQWSKVRRLCEL